MSMNINPAFKRIVLKLSGEALAGPQGSGIDPSSAAYIAEKVKAIVEMGVQTAIVIGAGNLWRGSTGVHRGMEQSTADHMGMIGTVMNGLALQDAFQRIGIVTRVQTAIQMNAVAEPYIRLRAIRHLEKGRVVIITGGTGNPYFTTDTAAALRAMEIDADIVIKATKVNGVYTADPKKDPTATRFSHLTYDDVLANEYNVMDMTAFALCREHGLPILVVDFWANNDLLEAVRGNHSVGTIIASKEKLAQLR
jgi:uridylate kinase